MRAASRFLDRIVDALAVLAAAILAVITIALAANVALRFFFRANLYGMVDAIEIGLMAATFLGAPWVLKKNAHVAVDLFISGLTPAVRRSVNRAICLVGALLSLAMCWTTLTALLVAFRRGSMTRGVLVVPEWILLAAPALGAALLTVVFLQQMVRGPEGEQQGARL